MVFTGLIMSITDIADRRLTKTSEKLIPLYREVAAIKLELMVKLDELKATELRLLGETEAKLRQNMIGDV